MQRFDIFKELATQNLHSDSIKMIWPFLQIFSFIF